MAPKEALRPTQKRALEEKHSGARIAKKDLKTFAS
jgi:hypothetical protein